MTQVLNAAVRRKQSPTRKRGLSKSPSLTRRALNEEVSMLDHATAEFICVTAVLAPIIVPILILAIETYFLRNDQ